MLWNKIVDVLNFISFFLLCSTNVIFSTAITTSIPNAYTFIFIYLIVVLGICVIGVGN